MMNARGHRASPTGFAGQSGLGTGDFDRDPLGSRRSPIRNPDLHRHVEEGQRRRRSASPTRGRRVRAARLGGATAGGIIGPPARPDGPSSRRVRVRLFGGLPGRHDGAGPDRGAVVRTPGSVAIRRHKRPTRSFSESSSAPGQALQGSSPSRGSRLGQDPSPTIPRTPLLKVSVNAPSHSIRK